MWAFIFLYFDNDSFVVPSFFVIIAVVSDMNDSANLIISIQVSYVLCDYVPMCSGANDA